ncbi:hypothetical protein NECAME_08559 [Necator americanus]|uniref:CUB domain-containing protein n=1 Tax=Necator americanus TaxID=51031 RepID=W2THQ9_NECAM|nr:hypothetical protein NECAME_08559 [Necator americanus]ETN81338.1 hypothetical protein NECAME_08559 [Necator americanus]
MRVLLLVLVSIISTSGYLSPSITSKLRSQGLDVDELLEIRKQLDEVKEEARAEIALTPEKQIELQGKVQAEEIVEEIKHDAGAQRSKRQAYRDRCSSRNSLPTMIPRDTKYLETLGSAIISFNDLFMVNTHYNCTKKCNPDTSAKCQMNGYPHPRNCAKCICPGGYGGDLCDERPDDGCGEVLMANTSYQYQDVEVGDRNAGFNKRVELTTCTYWIQAPKGSKVEVKIEKLNAGLINDGCHYGGVEIKSQEDQRLTGYRYCRQEDTNVILESTHNIVPVIFFNRYYVSEVKIRYRAVPGDDVTDDTSVPPESETTATSTKPVTAIRPRPQTRPSRRCADTNRCELLMKLRNFCQNPAIPYRIKFTHCAQSCHLC